MNRIDALKQAKWRHEHRNYVRCRLCGGLSKNGPYCLRHFRCLTGYKELCEAATRNERLDECDLAITMRITFKRVQFHDGRWLLSDRRQILRTAREGRYVLILYDVDGETELNLFHSVVELIEYMRRYAHIMSVRNRHATKALIL